MLWSGSEDRASKCQLKEVRPQSTSNELCAIAKKTSLPTPNRGFQNAAEYWSLDPGGVTEHFSAPSVCGGERYYLALERCFDSPGPQCDREGVSYRGSDVIEVRPTGSHGGFDVDTFAFVPGLDFHDGTIEVDVAGSLLPSALPGARGFIGVAFRIGGESEGFAYEGLYIRPTNGRAEDQVRRNHSTQYFSYPGFDFERLRR
jgi:hypothetical protein